MAEARVKAMHPYITRRKNYCGGQPIIKGTKFPVRSVITYVLQQGMTPEELVATFPHLTLAQVYDALSYYYDHKAEIDRDLTANTEEYWKAKVKPSLSICRRSKLRVLKAHDHFFQR